MRFYSCAHTISLSLIVHIACVFIFNQTFAQPTNLSFETYDKTKGLSQNYVYAIAQDHKGFMWFGTDEGLNRFDGHQFRIFRHNPNDKNSITDNSVRGLAVADNGVLWIGSANGISRYYPETEFIEQLAVDYDNPSLPNGTSVNEIRKAPDGKIWIAYLGSGVDVYDPKKNEFLHYTVHRSDEYRLVDDYVVALYFMRDGVTLLGTRSGIQFVGSDKVPLNPAEALKRYPWYTRIDNSITSFFLSSDERTLYIGTELAGFYKVDILTNEVVNYNTANNNLQFNNNVPSVFEDSRGNVWVGAEAIYRFDKTIGRLLPYNEQGIQGAVVNRNPVLDIFEDRDKNIWLGTFRMGVLKYNPDNSLIRHYHTDQGKGSITNNQVLSFGQDKEGNLWVGTDGGGLFRLSRDMNSFDRPLNKLLKKAEVIKCIYSDPHGNFWLGTWDAGMIRYDPDRQFSEQFHPDRNNFQSRHVWDLEADSLGNFWVGTLRDGLAYFNPVTGEYRYFKSNPADSTSLVNNDVLCLHLDSRNTLWVGTSGGLSILASGTDKFLNLKRSALSANVLTIHEDADHKMWLGTNGGGIVIINHRLEVEKTIGERDGLPSSTICAIQPDERGDIWVSTYNGLVKIDHHTFSVTTIPEIAGLQGKEFIPRSSFRWKRGALLFGGVNGFNLLYPDSLQFNPIPKKVVFTSLRINNDEIKPGSAYKERNILEKSLAETDDLNLSYKDYSFTLTFSSLTYNWQNNLQYAYLLDGLDKEWQYTSAEKRFIHYTNLDPGNYTLHVKSSFDGKTWPDEAATLHISVTPPWWGTLWFQILAVAATAGFLFVLYKTRVRFLQKQQHKLEDLVILRTQELKKSNDEIQVLLREVAGSKATIEAQMLEVSRVNEEISAQRDILALRSLELEKTQTKLKQTNANLEALVSERTQKLTDALQELEIFLYRASHDLRGPISSMLGLIAVATLETDPIRYNKLYTDFLKRTVMGLDRTLQKLLQKHTIDKKKVSRETINKSALLILIGEITSELPVYRSQDFHLAIDDRIRIETDKVLLGIVISNLLENAFFYSDQSADRTVTLGVSQTHGANVITVEDRGPGMKEEVKDNIFTMFYRGHELSTGNGLGLYLVKNVLSKIQGDITVETRESEFSRFTVSLPLNGVPL